MADVGEPDAGGQLLETHVLYIYGVTTGVIPPSPSGPLSSNARRH